MLYRYPFSVEAVQVAQGLPSDLHNHGSNCQGNICGGIEAQEPCFFRARERVIFNHIISRSFQPIRLLIYALALSTTGSSLLKFSETLLTQ